MAATVTLEQFFGAQSYSSPQIGVGAEKEVGCAKDRRSVIFRGAGQRLAGRTVIFTAANCGDGSLLKENGNSGVFVSSTPGRADLLLTEIQDRFAAAGAAMPPNWASNANLRASCAAHGGNAAAVDRTPSATAANLTAQVYNHFDLVVVPGLTVTNPALVANIGTHPPQVAYGNLTLNAVDKVSSLRLDVQQIRIKRRTEGKFTELFQSFKKHVEAGVSNGLPFQTPGGAPGPPVATIGDWVAMGMSVPVFAPFGGAAAGARLRGIGLFE